MQEPRTSSTLELVVDEQQMQNMSQVDLSRPSDGHRQPAQRSNLYSFQQLREWPSRFRDNFNARIEEAKSKSETKTQFVFEVLHSFSSIAIWILCFICTIFVPVILFFIGLINLDNCQDRRPLPYLIFATGFTMTASNLFNLAMALDLPILTNHQILTSEIKNTISSILNIIFNCVVAFLYILSAYMVFTIGINKRKPLDVEIAVEAEAIMDCSYLLYFFTFWFITLTLSLLVILSIVASIFFAYNKYRLAIIRGSTSKSQPNTNSNPTDSSYTTNRL